MDSVLTTLGKMPVGSTCRVYDIDSDLPIKSRLSELGFYKGACIDKLQVGFGGSPIAFRVCGAVIAIRSEDADRVFVTC